MKSLFVQILINVIQKWGICNSNRMRNFLEEQSRLMDRIGLPPSKLIYGL